MESGQWYSYKMKTIDKISILQSYAADFMKSSTFNGIVNFRWRFSLKWRNRCEKIGDENVNQVKIIPSRWIGYKSIWKNTSKNSPLNVEWSYYYGWIWVLHCDDCEIFYSNLYSADHMNKLQCKVRVDKIFRVKKHGWLTKISSQKTNT
jgi:hypothetical protein